MYKKTISILILAIMILSIVLPTTVLAITTQDNGKLKVYPTTTGYENEDLKGFDIKGYINNGETLISSTFGDHGYHTFLNVDAENGVMTGEQVSLEHLLDMLYTGVTGEETQTIDGIQLKVGTSFINDGENIKIQYTLKNTKSVAATYSLATTADVEIDGDDSATIQRLGNGNVSLLTREGESDKGVQFVFYGAGVTGTTDVDNLWIGGWSSDYFTHMFDTNPSVLEVEDDDSAFCFSWVNRTINAGQTITHSVIMEVGELNAPVINITTPNGSVLENDDVVIDGTVKDSDLIDTATIKYKVDGETTQTLAPVISMNGTVKNFSIDLTALALTPATEHTIEAWAIDSQGNESNHKTITFTITTLKAITITPTATEWTQDNVQFTLNDLVNAPADVLKYQYKIGSGNWVDAVTATQYMALNETGTVVISARAIGTVEGDISPITTITVKVDKTGPAVSLNGLGIGSLAILATDAHSGMEGGTVEYGWTTENAQPEEWLDYKGELDVSGLEGTQYLWVRTTDHLGNVAIYSKVFNEVVAPTIAMKDSHVDEYAYFELNDTTNDADDVYTYQFKINNGEWQNIGKDTKFTIRDITEGKIKITARTVDNLGRYSEEVVKETTVSIKEEKDQTPKTGI